jgi:hypothetical protein
MNKYLLVLLLIFLKDLFGQPSVSNLFEYQLGNLPETDPTNLATHYDQLNLSFRYNEFLFSAKLEHFQTQGSEASYDQVAQRTLSFQKDGFQFSAGNFYQIFGRGLLLRSYEIPGAIREDSGLRSRYGFYRDIDGFRAAYEISWLEITLLRGRTLREDLPPPISDDIRRENLLEGGQATIYVSEFSFTGMYLRTRKEEKKTDYTAIGVAANLPFDMQIYTEYARQLGENGNFIDISDNSSHAFYASMNLISGPTGLSAEFKDYHNFQLTFNDPPPLVKEHDYLLLNRSTHSLEPFDETGWQLEIFYTLTGDHTITGNVAEAVNSTPFRNFIFKEKFIEIASYINSKFSLKGFVDLSQEDIRLEKDRYTYGIYAENEWPDLWGTTIDLEYQEYLWGITNPVTIINRAVLFSLSYAPDLSFGITWENTSDPAEPRQDWIGCNFSYQYGQHHLINLFYGKRRGGNACTAGICYQILPFEGFEFRLTSNL